MRTLLLKQELNSEKGDVRYLPAFGWAVLLCCFGVQYLQEWCWHDNVLVFSVCKNDVGMTMCWCSVFGRMNKCIHASQTLLEHTCTWCIHINFSWTFLYTDADCKCSKVGTMHIIMMYLMIHVSFLNKCPCLCKCNGITVTHTYMVYYPTVTSCE